MEHYKNAAMAADLPSPDCLWPLSWKSAYLPMSEKRPWPPQEECDALLLPGNQSIRHVGCLELLLNIREEAQAGGGMIKGAKAKKSKRK